MSDTSPKLVLALPLFDALLDPLTDASSEMLSFAVDVATRTVASRNKTHLMIPYPGMEFDALPDSLLYVMSDMLSTSAVDVSNEPVTAPANLLVPLLHLTTHLMIPFDAGLLARLLARCLVGYAVCFFCRCF
jgi:hypothetical protein